VCGRRVIIPNEGFKNRTGEKKTKIMRIKYNKYIYICTYNMTAGRCDDACDGVWRGVDSNVTLTGR